MKACCSAASAAGAVAGVVAVDADVAAAGTCSCGSSSYRCCCYLCRP